MNEISQSHAPQRLLMVDDNESNIDLLERIFAREFIISSARNSAEALHVLLEQPIDLILLDVMLPDASGLELLQIIREMPDTNHIPVLLLSALSEINDIANGLRLGANDYITKPFDIDVVLARVRTQARLKHLHDERQQTITSLEAANRMKDQLMRIASHDLRNPLNNLQIVNQIMRTFAKDNPEMIHYLDLASDSINVMKDFIQEFLEAAILQSGTLEFQAEVVALDGVIKRVIKQHVLPAEKKNITLEIQNAHLDKSVLADPNRLTQVLSNLVSNAIKYSPPESTVIVRALQESEMMRVEVVDQGAGIPVAERAFLFQPFSKLSTRPTADESSIGLGLWIVKQLMTLQGGNIGVDCPSEGGSIFWIMLPVANTNED